MDTIACWIYIMGYETTRKSQAFRTTSATSHLHASFRQNLPHGGSYGEMFPEFGCSLVSSISDGRPASNTQPRKMGTPLIINPETEEKAETDAFTGSCSSRTCHRPMDAATYRTTDKIRFWRPIYACRGMETFTQRFWMELSKATTTRFATKRKGHRLVEAQDMAFFKKKPARLMRTSSFWTKADFCLFPTSEKHGPRLAAHRSFATVTCAIKSRPLDALLYPLAVDVLAFMSDFMRIILLVRKSFCFYGICFATYAGKLSYFGIAAPSIRGLMSKRFFERPNGFMSTGSPAMHRNLIRLNTFGLMANVTFPTVCTKTRIIWDHICIVLSVEFGVLRDYLNRVSNIQKYLGHDGLVSIIC
jgi:hypothetical protein